MSPEFPAWLTTIEWADLDEPERLLVSEAQTLAHRAIREGAMAQAIDEFPITIPMPSVSVIDETLREAFERNVRERTAKLARRPR